MLIIVNALLFDSDGSRNTDRYLHKSPHSANYVLLDTVYAVV